MKFLLPNLNLHACLSALLFLSTVIGVDAAYISEFVAINDTGSKDDRGNRSDWIEIANPGRVPEDISGWGLSDEAGRPFKWKFPAATIIPQSSALLVWASGDNQTAPGLALHTNFKLSGEGEYLGLTKPDGTVASEFGPVYPRQAPDVSYGISSGKRGYMLLPSPRSLRQNRAQERIGPRASDLQRSPAGPVVAGQALTISIRPRETLATVTTVTLAYRRMFNPEAYLPMKDDGVAPDAAAGDGTYTATIPANAALPEEMLRWRVILKDSAGTTATEPPYTQPQSMPRYDGTVIENPAVQRGLPILRWFSSQPGRASIFLMDSFATTLA